MKISANTLKFLTNLKQNNNRDWFMAHKPEYDLIKIEIKELTLELLNFLKSIDPSLISLEPKDCTYRIYRDIRFSKDKTPYKTHIGIFIAKGGKNSFNPGYYLHIEPDNSFIGGGLYMPQGEILKNVRQEIYYNIEEFLFILNNKNFKSYFKELAVYERLKNPPKGYDIDFEYIDLLKNKSFVVGHFLPVEKLQSDDLTQYISNVYLTMLPFIKFLYKAYEK